MHSNKNRTLPQSSPLLSVIVPIVNEADVLPQLIDTLQQQHGIDFEVILVDGGSTDRSLELAQDFAASAPFTLKILSSSPGRGKQMNTGVAAASGDYFLFLHADSAFSQGDAFQSGLNSLMAAEKNQNNATVAARFSLIFAEELSIPAHWRNFHIRKARQNRRGAIHGDQGFLLSRTFFAQIGPFNDTLPYLEDDRLSDRVFTCGRWILLDPEITTLPRRFAIEGYWRRDILNVLILALHQSGYGDWLDGLTAAYKAIPATGKTRVLPAISYIKDRLGLLTFREKLRFWAAIGHCIRNNLWQIQLLAKNRPNK